MKEHLSGYCFTCDEDIKHATTTQLIQQGHIFYAYRMDKLITCCDKYLNYQGDYVEKIM